MAPPNATTEVQASSEAAEVFVTNYYQAINKHANIDPFYINSSSRYPISADISINGAVVPTPADYSKLLEAQGKDVHYETESLDAHVMNPSFSMGAPENVYDNARKEKNGERMSIIVTVMGRVQYGKGRDAPQKMFNETFVLVPNWAVMTKNPPGGGWARKDEQISTIKTAPVLFKSSTTTKSALNEDNTKANVVKKPSVKKSRAKRT
ncbi:hypothetical protein F66182_9897 [Fusarium sp. NRRL 66182]|nr:hypothetical protein F66182_9897 [Fusarium sp. NRRL 66182]